MRSSGSTLSLADEEAEAQRQAVTGLSHTAF